VRKDTDSSVEEECEWWKSWVTDALEGVVGRKRMGGKKRASKTGRAKQWWTQEIEEARKEKREKYGEYMRCIQEKEEGVAQEMKRSGSYAS
jgi:hypothetical protein